MKRASVLTLVVITLFWWSLTGVFGGLIVVRIARHLDAGRRFKEAAGTVVESRVEVSHGTRSTQYRPIVRYRYSVGGTVFSGERYSFDESTSSDQHLSGWVMGAFPAGKAISVYYDPDRPGTAILSLPVPNGLLGELLFLQPFLGIGVLILYALISQPFAIRSVDRFLGSPASRPWEIPGWGCLDGFPSGWRVTPRPALLKWACVAYPWVSLAAAVVVIFAGGGFSNPPRWLVGCGFGAALAASAVIGKKLEGVWARRITLDSGTGTLTVSSPGESRSLPVAEIEALFARREPAPQDGRRSRSRTDSPQLCARLKGGEGVLLCDFIGTYEPEAVLRKAGEEIARTLGRPFRPLGPA